MSTLQDQIEARKQRIKELRLKRHSAAAESDHRNEHQHKRSRTEHSKPSSDSLACTASDAPLEGAADISILTYTGNLDDRDFDNYNSGDERVIQSEEQIGEEGQAKQPKIFDVMKAKVEEDIQRLEKRTNDEIKRIVRREFMQDAMTKNS